MFRLRAPDDCRPVIGPGACNPAPLTAGIIRGGENRFSQVSWQSIPWLCAAHATPADLTAPCHNGTASAAPRPSTLKAPTISISRLNHAASPPAVYASRRPLPNAMQQLAPGWWATPLPGRGRTCWTAIIGFGYFINFLLFRTYPGATKVRLRVFGAGFFLPRPAFRRRSHNDSFTSMNSRIKSLKR